MAARFRQYSAYGSPAPATFDSRAGARRLSPQMPRIYNLRVLKKGEGSQPGCPTCFSDDPDGYAVEMWYEARATLDPN